MNKSRLHSFVAAVLADRENNERFGGLPSLDHRPDTALQATFSEFLNIALMRRRADVDTLYPKINEFMRRLGDMQVDFVSGRSPPLQIE